MFIFNPVEGAAYRRDYQKVAAYLNKCKERNDWESAIKAIRRLCWEDLFFLCFFILGWSDVNHPWLVDRINEVNDDRHKTLDIWARYHWKAVDVNEPVPTPNGFKAHGSLVAGDLVFGSDGRPCRVIAAHPVTTDADCYRVTFDKGYSVVVSGDHRWKMMISSRDRLCGGRTKVREVILDTRDLAKEVDRAAASKSHVSPYVPVSPPVYGWYKDDSRCAKHRVVSVERVDPIPVSCITVDSDDGCYLIGKQFVCTHNSSIITIAGTIQDVLKDPSSRVCIFSHTKTIAKDFLRRIKTTFENNGLLNASFPDVIQENAVNTKGFMWSLDDGLQLLKGKDLGGYVMASGLIDSMPTGKHFTRRIYDDVVTRESVATSDQRAKVSECVKLSHALGDPKNGTHCFIGTRYHFGDFYGEIIRSGEYKVRQYACTENGEYPFKPEGVEDDVVPMGDGKAVLYSQEHIWNEFKLMGNTMFAAQMLMNPVKADEKAFDIGWIRYYEHRPHTRNFVFVDPAGSKKEGSAYTVMWVVGVDKRNYYYILDCVRDKLDLQGRQQNLFRIIEKWKAVKVFYERYSMQADIEYIEEKKREEGFYFSLQEVGGTRLSKDERILKLQPLFQEGRIIFPATIPYTDGNGKRRNLVEDFIMEEYLEFPVSQYKDMLDALARIRDEKVKITGPVYEEPATPGTDNPLLRWYKQSKGAGSMGWLNG